MVPPHRGPRRPPRREYVDPRRGDGSPSARLPSVVPTVMSLAPPSECPHRRRLEVESGWGPGPTRGSGPSPDKPLRDRGRRRGPFGSDAGFGSHRATPGPAPEPVGPPRLSFLRGPKPKLQVLPFFMFFQHVIKRTFPIIRCILFFLLSSAPLSRLGGPGPDSNLRVRANRTP